MSDEMSCASFSLLVHNLVCAGGDSTPRGVSLVPSLHALTNPERDIREGHVLLDSARVVLQWLGVVAKEDLRKILKRSRKGRDGEEVTCVLGGCNGRRGT